MISTRDRRAETTRFGNRQGKHDAGRLPRLQTTLLVPAGSSFGIGVLVLELWLA